MADGVFNIAKGRVAEFYNRVKAGDPSTSRLTVVAVKTTGIEADSVLQDYDNLSLLLAAANDEATNTGYARKIVTAAELAAFAPDDTENRVDIDMPDLTWTGVATSGGAWSKLLVCYDPKVAEGTDTEIVLLTYHDFAVTPDGSDITAVLPVGGFYRAT